MVLVLLLLATACVNSLAELKSDLNKCKPYSKNLKMNNMRYTTYRHTPAQCTIGRFTCFLLGYSFLIVGAYVLSNSFFPAIIESNNVFSYAVPNEDSFNLPLFIHLLVGILFIAGLHMVSWSMNISIPKRNIIFAMLLVLNIYCFVIGVNIPLLSTTKFWIIKEHYSLLQILENLKSKGELQLYYIMLFFTFVVPVLKMIILAFEIFISKMHRKNNLLLSSLAKWGMLDVLIISVIVSTMKSGSGFAEMTTNYGFDIFHCICYSVYGDFQQPYLYK